MTTSEYQFRAGLVAGVDFARRQGLCRNDIDWSAWTLQLEQWRDGDLAGAMPRPEPASPPAASAECGVPFEWEPPLVADEAQSSGAAVVAIAVVVAAASVVGLVWLVVRWALA